MGVSIGSSSFGSVEGFEQATSSENEKNESFECENHKSINGSFGDYARKPYGMIGVTVGGKLGNKSGR